MMLLTSLIMWILRLHICSALGTLELLISPSRKFMFLEIVLGKLSNELFCVPEQVEKIIEVRLQVVESAKQEMALGVSVVVGACVI